MAGWLSGNSDQASNRRSLDLYLSLMSDSFCPSCMAVFQIPQALEAPLPTTSFLQRQNSSYTAHLGLALSL